MRTKRTSRVLVALLAVGLLPALAASAHHGPQVEDVVKEATGKQGMTCSAATGQQVCSGFSSTQGYRTAVITPETGPLTKDVTTAPAYQSRVGSYSMDPADESWNVAMHNVGCDNLAAVTAFMKQTAALTVLDTSVGPTTVGECRMTGQLMSASFDFAPTYVVTSDTLPSALPTPIPTPTPTPTAVPTSTTKPTVRPTVRPTAAATGTATATASATATGTATGTATATASPSESASANASASASPTAIPVNTPEQSVAGIIFTPEPSSAPPAPAGGGGGGGDWARSVPSANQVSVEPAKLAGSGLVALLLLLLMGFIGELFNNTFEANYDRILAGWQKSWLGRVGRAFGGLWGGGK